MTEQQFNGIIYLPKAKYDELVANGTVIIGDQTLTYDRYSTIYITPDDNNIKQDDLAANLADIIAQIPTKVGQLENDSNFVTKQYVQENGGKINSISVNGVTQTIDANKNVNLEISIGEEALTPIQESVNALQQAISITRINE